MLSPMTFTLAILAALAFTTGGVLMKYADGLHHGGAVAGFVALFAASAMLQSQAMRGSELGVIYALVLGLEAALAFGLGVAIVHEAVTVTKLTAVALVVAGSGCAMVSRPASATSGRAADFRWGSGNGRLPSC